MIRWSRHGLQGCVPVAASAIPRPSASSKSCWRRWARSEAASSKSAQRPVRISTSDAISSPTRCSSSGVSFAAACSVLEPVRQRERLGVEDGELLLDRDREIAGLLELLAREAKLLVRAEALRVSHPPQP